MDYERKENYKHDIRGFQYHVRLCLEGIPLHAWNQSIAKRAVARACDMDYVEQLSLDRRDTRALCLWAWTYNPSDIPKVTWLTLSGRSGVPRRSSTSTWLWAPRPYFQGPGTLGQGGGPPRAGWAYHPSRLHLALRRDRRRQATS